MSAERTMLVHDAVAFLRRAVHARAEGNELLSLFARRLGLGAGQDPSVSAALDSASVVRGGERSSLHVAILGYACEDKAGRDRYGEAFLRQLEWLIGRPNFSTSGEPCGALDDPAILLGVSSGVAASVVPGPLRDRVTAWFTQLSADFARLTPSEKWPRHFQAAVLARVLGRSWRSSEAAPEWLKGALQACGIVSPDDRIAGRALTAATAGVADVTDPFEAALRLAALEWGMARMLSESPEAMSIDGVRDLLTNVTRIFQRWTWEEKPRTAKNGAKARQWHIENEYHVQSLLYAVLKPFFANLEEEKYVVATGVYQPRADLALLALELVIEVKYWRRGDKVRKLIEEIAADASLYLRSDSPYRQMIAFIWDEAARTEEHDELRRGLAGLPGVHSVVIIPRPSVMDSEEPEVLPTREARSLRKK